MCKNLSLLGVLVFLLFILWSPTAQAALTDNVSGWMWSSNIGWISANCINTGDCTSTQDYGLNINPTTGALSGYAWSENIGYISFNRFETNDPPSAPYNSGSGPIAVYNLSTKSITGWARALSGCERVPGNPVSVCASTGAGAAAGGFDGWIKLSGTARDGSPYGIGLSGDNIGGHAWGADVIGWVEFNLSAPDLNVDGPTLLFTSSLTQVPFVPHDVDLTWATDNISSCTASGGWSDSKSAGGGTQTVTVGSPTTYNLQCIGNNGDVINRSIPITIGATAHSGGISASNCTIAVGEMDCLSVVEWFASDYAAPISVEQDGSQFSSSPVGHEMLPISHGDTPFKLSDIDALSASTMAIAACEDGSSWNGSVCASDTPIPYGSLSISNCEIAEGDSDCDGSVTWNSGNLASPPSVEHNGSVIFVFNSGTRTVSFGYGPNNFSLTDTDSGNELDSFGVTTVCSTGLAWDPVSGTCITPPPPTPSPPAINIDANPNLIRSGETADIVIDIDSDADLTCTLRGVQSSIYTFTHTANPAPVQYVETTRPLTDSQIIDIECTAVGFPLVSSSATTRVNVIPGVQEI